MSGFGLLWRQRQLRVGSHVLPAGGMRKVFGVKHLVTKEFGYSPALSKPTATIESTSDRLCRGDPIWRPGRRREVLKLCKGATSRAKT